ncbi:alpha/beta hydrolase [Flavobacterium sp.]|uniref:alpha/beta fold hydrolase n=1 Tax=Flavobacterium sp. TaxID=239 RepID=UPI0026384C3E|nr:alpha/beta hydrolase [Flavobacterium sp.]MDD2985803.1 alpha/beta hydrolase [Flavobacterium sp.]
MNTMLKNILTKSIGAYINLLSYLSPKKATQLAYRFFSEPREGKLLEHNLPSLLKNAEREVMILDNQQFPIYTWQGNATKILLVHGWESNAARWEPLFPYLQKTGSTIIALDAPAHGLAEGKEFSVPNYAAFIHEVVKKSKPQVMIGHSIGGSACLYFQNRYSTLSIKKMVLLGAPADLGILLSNYAKLLGLNSKIIPLLDAYFLERFKTNSAAFVGEKLAKTLQVRGIISHDVADEVVLYEESQKIAKGWKDSIFIETNGFGHSMHDPALYQKIENFIVQS